MHREADRSPGLHLFQELSTLGQQLAHALLLRQGCGRVLPLFPAKHAANLKELRPFDRIANPNENGHEGLGSGVMRFCLRRQ